MIPYNKILIRCINLKTNRAKDLYPSIATNSGLMKTMGWQISDPDYDLKIFCYKNKKDFSRNEIAEASSIKEPIPFSVQSNSLPLDADAESKPIKKRVRKPKTEVA